MVTKKIVEILLRIGVAFAFIYPPISAIFNPSAWIGYFPQFLLGIVPDLVVLHAFGFVEVFLGIWILWGRNIFIPSIAATVLLLLIVVFNFSQLDVLFRDITIVFMTVSLIILSNKQV